MDNGFTSSIWELDRWCVLTNHIIVVKGGKLCGLVKMEDR
jgi:hypothetical protein